MYIFNQCFSAKSKTTNKNFFKVILFEKREAQDKTVYFKQLDVFVEENVYNSIVKQNFKFGDIVEVVKSKPKYFGGSEQLTGLTLLEESPYFD